jgi:lipopolysaccharide export system ATP-binding protein
MNPFPAVEPLIKEEIKNMVKQNRGRKGFIITDHDYRHVLDICSLIKEFAGI